MLAFKTKFHLFLLFMKKGKREQKITKTKITHSLNQQTPP